MGGWQDTLAGYEDVNDANRLALDPVMRLVVSGRAVDAQAASASQMGRFETETLALRENRAARTDLNGQWIDRFHDPNGLKYIVLDTFQLAEVAVSGQMVRGPFLLPFNDCERRSYARNSDPDLN